MVRIPSRSFAMDRPWPHGAPCDHLVLSIGQCRRQCSTNRSVSRQNMKKMRKQRRPARESSVSPADTKGSRRANRSLSRQISQSLAKSRRRAKRAVGFPPQKNPTVEHWSKAPSACSSVAPSHTSSATTSDVDARQVAPYNYAEIELVPLCCSCGCGNVALVPGPLPLP